MDAYDEERRTFVNFTELPTQSVRKIDRAVRGLVDKE